MKVTSYAGCTGTWYHPSVNPVRQAQINGLFWVQSSVNLAMITDGTSQTLIVGERAHALLSCAAPAGGGVPQRHPAVRYLPGYFHPEPERDRQRHCILIRPWSSRSTLRQERTDQPDLRRAPGHFVEGPGPKAAGIQQRSREAQSGSDNHQVWRGFWPRQDVGGISAPPEPFLRHQLTAWNVKVHRRTGTATVLNQSSSAFGDGWTLEGLEQITADGTSGVILSLGDNGESLWFAGNPAVGSSYTTPVGDFSTLTLTSSGYTRTLPDGTQILFNSSGYETATIDLNNNHTTYSYNGSNQLTSVEDQYGNFTTFTYSSGHLSTIEDPASRFTTFTFSGSDLEAVQQADSSRVTYTYDGSGRMTQVQDQRSNITSIAYDSAERVGTISLPEGATQLFSSYQEQGWTNSGTSGSPAAATLQAEAATTYTDPNGYSSQIRPDWMGLGQLSESTDPYGNVSANDISTTNGLPYVSIDPLGRITQTVYDSQGSPVTIAYPDLTEDQYTYNSDDEPLTYEDGNNHTTSYTYNSNGNLTVIQDPMHNRTTMTYTSTGQVQTVTNANDYTTTYLYDSQGRQTTVQFPNSTTNLYSYNSQGNVTKVTDGRGNPTTYSFDALNRETGETDALGDITTITMDAAGNVTKVQAPTPAGQTARTTTYAYDSMNRLTTVTDPLGYQTVYGLDNDGNVVTITDNMGRVTTIQYDEMDRPVVTIDPMTNHITTTYDADGEKLTVTDAMNRTTSYAYSVRGWVAQVTDPMGYLATYTYSPTGQNLGAYQTNLTQFEADANTYNADDELIAQQNGVSETTSYSYDGVRNITTVEDANTNVVSYVYNSVNELTEVIQPAGVTVSYTYDNSGNQQTSTDALGHTTTVLFDALDRATTLISAVSGTTTISYDSASRETSLTDPNGNETQWAYNADDQVTTLTQPNSATVTYIYDKDGELTDTTDADGRRTTYSFNSDGDTTGETWVGASPAEKITYTYDADNEMTGADDAFATLTMAYNADGQLGTYVTSGPGSNQPTVTLTYGYDQLGDETSVKDSLSSQGIATYTFNNAMEMTDVSTSYGGTAGPLITFTYDNGGRLTNTSRTGPGSSDQVNTTITYDSDNRVVTITDGVSTATSFGYTNTPLATFAYGYDSASRVTTEISTDPGGTDTYTYTYDNANELTGAYKNGTQVESYAYDSNGNRTGTGYSTTVMNETATSPGPVTYTYDNAGNMITSKTGSTTTTYTYDYRNRLTEVTTGTVVATYTYNALNQRIGVDDSTTQIWTVYDGTSPDANPYDDFNSSGLTVRYLFGASVVNGAVVSGILARTNSSGTTAWYLTDKLGSVREIVGTSGTVLDQVVYDSFGNIVTETNAANGDRFKFAGMQYDAIVPAYFDHARWYGSTVGRFSAQDPSGFSAGDSDLYRYVRNSTTNAVDPDGLDGRLLPPAPPPIVGPTDPLNEFGPLNPGGMGPLNPFNPLNPGGGINPLNPLNPLNPGGEMDPLSPLNPLGPGGPMDPLNPPWEPGQPQPTKPPLPEPYKLPPGYGLAPPLYLRHQIQDPTYVEWWSPLEWLRRKFWGPPPTVPDPLDPEPPRGWFPKKDAPKPEGPFAFPPPEENPDSPPIVV